jgi:phosphoenolpyruvate synthase/pyruvate phosphate dikinase
LHAVDLTPQEVKEALSGKPTISAAEVAAYANYRQTKTTADPPRYLSFPPSGPPPAEWLPPTAARLQSAVNICLLEMFSKHENAKATKTITGFAASPGDVTGTARLVRASADMGRVRDGDILVTQSTGPSYNVLLPLLRGVITDRGGTLSHAALVAREYGIPAVVGCGNATAMIPDGAKIRINGTDGKVDILS